MRSPSKISRFSRPFAFCLAGAVFSTLVLWMGPATAAGPVPLRPEDSSLPEGIERVTSVEGITEYLLENGLRVLLFPDPSKPTITVNITYLVGSLHESYGETGMAHLLEHLVFKGTPNHPDIPQELTEHGAHPNGTTWFDRTNYFETFRATDENLEWALDLEADRMIHSFIAKKDLDSEMTVVRNEFERGENNPFRVLMQRTLATSFLWHNYGKSTIGARSDIEHVSIDRLQAFYRKYYQPDNAVLLVAGKFEEASTLALIAKKFGPIPRPARRLQQPYTAEPAQDGERTVTLRRVGDVQLLMVGYHIPAGSHPDFAALDLLTHILADTPSGRLHKALVETKKASRTYGFNFQLHDPGIVLMGAEVRQEDSLEEARGAFLSTIEEIRRKPPTPKEVERARTQLLKNIDLTLNDVNRVGLSLSEWVAMGDWRLFFLHRDRLKKVTSEDVHRVAAAYLKPANHTLGQFIPTQEPDRAEIPQRPDLAAMLKDYRGDAAVAAGEAFDPSPGNIESRVRRLSIGSNLKLALLPKKTRGETVVARIRLHFGDEKSLMHKSTIGGLTGTMLMRGTANRTRQEIQDALDRLKATARVSGSSTGASASLETVKENLPEVLRLLGEVFRQPSFPAGEFDTLKEERLAAIEQQRSNPQAIAANTFARHGNPYPKGHVHYSASFDEQMAAIESATLEDLKGFHRDFYGASHGEVAVSGDFEPGRIVDVLKEIFPDWNSSGRFQRVERPFQEIAPANRSVETPDKANAVFIAGMPLAVSDNHQDYPALVLGNYMLGGGFLNSRLAVRIRQKEGLSYGIRAYLNASAEDDHGSFTTWAIAAPQNIEKVESAFREEVQRALQDGFTAKEIAAAKSGFLQSRQVTRSQDDRLAGTMASRLFQGRTLAWDEEFERRIDSLTGDRIVSALRRHLDPARMIIVKAGDFAAAAEQ